MKLTKAIREDIAKKAVMDLFVPALLKQFEAVKEGIFALVKDQYKDFDWEHVEPYKKYIEWRETIHIEELPGEWKITHFDTFKKMCGLPGVYCFDLPFRIPTTTGVAYLDNSYKNKVEDILRPYMIQYFTAKKAFENIQQVLRGINTTKQIEDMLPEFKKYLPIDTEKITALVPIEQINRVKMLFQQKQGGEKNG